MLLRRSLAALRRRRDRGAIALYAALALVIVVEVGAATVPAVEQRMMAAHHLRSMPLAEWVALQTVPKMYSYGHWVSYADGPFGPWGATRWVNHYPGRVVRMEGVREDLAKKPVFVRVKSHYRGGVRLTTVYRVDAASGALVVERVEGGP
jgi:hypothetical protein